MKKKSTGKEAMTTFKLRFKWQLPFSGNYHGDKLSFLRNLNENSKWRKEKNSCVVTYEEAESKQQKMQQKQMDWIRE